MVRVLGKDRQLFDERAVIEVVRPQLATRRAPGGAGRAASETEH